MLKDVAKGVELSLGYAYRLIQDAYALEKGERYLSAIPLYILGYEEVGKATFLVDKLSKKHTVHEKEWKGIAASPMAHKTKIGAHYARAIQILEKQTPWQFEGANAWRKKWNLIYHKTSRDALLYKYKKSLSTIQKLPIVKLACLYVDYHGGEWRSLRAYSPSLLKDLCTYLHYESFGAYYVGQSELLAFSLGLPQMKKHIPPDLEKYYAEHTYMKELDEIQKVYFESAFIRAREHAFAIIETIANDYKYLLKEPANLLSPDA